MPRRMSFSKTVPQFKARTKDVTRRDGWLDLEPGDVLTGIEKGMGLRKGERQVVLGDIEVVSTRRERLGDITPEDVAREGFPGETPAFFVKKYGKPADHTVTRIEYRYVEYYIADGRPLDQAVVCEVCATEAEAKRERHHYGKSAQVWRVADGNESTAVLVQ